MTRFLRIQVILLFLVPGFLLNCGVSSMVLPSQELFEFAKAAEEDENEESA